MPYPASSYPEGVDLTIIAGNQLHQVINGEANEVVSTTSGDIPSVRKALADSMMFKVPVDWVQGEVTTDPLETRLYNGQPYWAPEATLANPITLGISPVATTDWLLAPQGYRNEYNLGKYQAGILISDSQEYVVYNGKSYFAVSPPYTTTSTTPDNDTNMFEGGYTTIKSSAEVFSNTNLLSNSNFLTSSPDTITHPNATPESYVAGTQIFSGVYAGDSGCTVTFIDGRVNCTAGDYKFKLPNTGGLERVPVFASSVSDYDGIPEATGVSHTLVGDEYVVTVTPSAGDVFSVKLEQGSVATRHEVGGNPNEIANAGDSQLAGGKIWSVENRVVSVGDKITSDVKYLKIDEGSLWELYGAPSGTVTAINPETLSIEIDSTSYIMAPYEIKKVYTISDDVTLPNFVTTEFFGGGGFSIASGKVLSINTNIKAGYFQIFFGDGEALPTYLKTDTPEANRSKAEGVKMAWFGVKGDAFVPGNYGSSLPPAALGDVPSGTDSTEAFKKAVKFVEWGSMHGAKFMVQRSRMTLVGTPNTSILVKGNGIIKQQAFATEIAQVYSLADAGNPIFGTTPLEACKFSDWQFNIDMQDGHIFWQPINNNDEFVSAEFLLNRCNFKRMRLTPCGITAGQKGVFFHNRSATVYDGAGNVTEWLNSLGWPSFEDCEITFGELNPPQLGTYAPQVGIDKVFYYSGFGRGDRMNLKRFISTQFKTFIRCENSQAVEVNIDSGCELRTEINDAIFFDYASFAGQFKLNGSGVFLKGANQTLLRTAVEDDKSDFTDSAEFSILNIRMEGGANRHTLIDIESGRVNLEGFTHNYAMSNIAEVNACDMRISGTAEVFAKSAGVPGIVLFDEYDSGKIKSAPALTADGVRFSGSDGLDNVSYIIGGVTKSMPRAIAQGDELPWVSLSNTPTILGADVVESPASYGGRNAKGGKTREVTLTASDYSVNGETFYLPSWCVVESIKVTRRSTDITQFAKIRTTINASGNAINSDYTFPSNDGEYLAEMLPDTTFITVPTNDKGKREINFTVLNASDQGVAGGPLMSVTIRYRSLMTWSECPNSGLQSDPEFISL